MLSKKEFVKAAKERADAKLEKSKENALALVSKKLENGKTLIGVGISPDPKVVSFIKGELEDNGWRVEVIRQTKKTVNGDGTKTSVSLRLS